MTSHNQGLSNDQGRQRRETLGTRLGVSSYDKFELASLIFARSAKIEREKLIIMPLKGSADVCNSKT